MFYRVFMLIAITVVPLYGLEKVTIYEPVEPKTEKQRAIGAIIRSITNDLFAEFPDEISMKISNFRGDGQGNILFSVEFSNHQTEEYQFTPKSKGTPKTQRFVRPRMLD